MGTTCHGSTSRLGVETTRFEDCVYGELEEDVLMDEPTETFRRTWQEGTCLQTKQNLVEHGYNTTYETYVYHKKLEGESFMYLFLFMDDMPIATCNMIEV